MILVPQPTIDDYLARGWWGEQTLGELLLARARQRPDALAVVDPPNLQALCGLAPRRSSWAALVEAVGRMTALLHARGLRRDDVLLVQLPNGLLLHTLYLACAFGGIVVTPVPVQYRGHELEHVATTTGARAAITVAAVGGHLLAQGLREHLGARLPVWGFGPGLPAGVEALDDAWATAPAWDAAALLAHQRSAGVTAHDVLTICWTSGTEARAKGVPRNHNEWLIVGRSVADAGQLQPGARMVIPFPFVNMAGLSTCLAAWLLVGAELHHHHPFDLEVFIGQLRDHAVDYTVAAPAVLSLLLKSPERLAGLRLDRLRRIGSGGGPVAAWLVTELAERFGIELVNYFGSNEGAALSSTPQDVPDRAHRSQYFPRFGVPGFPWQAVNADKVRTRLVDLDSGEDIVEPGHVGELRFRGPTIFSGYVGEPELTARAFDAQGWYRTGDLFEIAGDRGQYYRFAGRHKDIVIRGGMNISSEEVENLLLAHPRVREAAVIGVPDPVMGERVCAVVVPQPGPGLTLAELVAFLRDEQAVAAFKWPERLVQVDQLPRNPLGKVLKRELRRQHAMLADHAAETARPVPEGLIR